MIVLLQPWQGRVQGGIALITASSNISFNPSPDLSWVSVCNVRTHGLEFDGIDRLEDHPFTFQITVGDRMCVLCHVVFVRMATEVGLGNPESLGIILIIQWGACFEKLKSLSHQ